MCDPSTLAGLKLAGTGVQAGAQLSAGNANAQIAGYNARAADMAARDAVDIGREEEMRHRMKVRQLVGAQRASFAAQGVDPSAGSALATQLDSAKMGELDVLQIRANAARDALRIKTQAKGFRFEKKQANRGGLFNAAGTTLGGIGGTYKGLYVP